MAQSRYTFADFAKRAGVTIEDIHNAVRQNYLICDISNKTPLIVDNIFAKMYCKAVREGYDITSLPKWQGARGKLKKRLNGISIYVAKDSVHALRPDGICVPFETIQDAEEYCLSTTEFIKRNSRTRTTVRRAKPCYLSPHELQYLLTAIPINNQTKLLRNKIAKALHGTYNNSGNRSTAY